MRIVENECLLAYCHGQPERIVESVVVVEACCHLLCSSRFLSRNYGNKPQAGVVAVSSSIDPTVKFTHMI